MNDATNDEIVQKREKECMGLIPDLWLLRNPRDEIAILRQHRSSH
jgi:hypothetical protein